MKRLFSDYAPLVKKVPPPIYLMVLIGLFVVVFFFVKQGMKPSVEKALPKDAEAKLLIQEVGELLILPSGEMPTVATVSDKNNLQQEAFFTRAQNGDKILVYAKAKQVILYRPSVKKIVNVAQLETDTNAQTIQTSK